MALADHKDVAVFVMSFDGASDVWGPFFKLFFKFWPDCPFPVYLETHKLTYPDERVTSLQIGEDTSFSESLAKSLAAIPHDYILLLNDDYLLTEPPDEEGFDEILKLMKQRGAGYFRVRPSPPPDTRLGTVGKYGYGSISTGQMFRAGLQAALWRKSVMESLIIGPESPRNFEVRATERSWDLPDEFLCLTRDSEPPPSPIPYFCTGVIRGYWVPGAVKLCRQHGIEVDLTQRQIQPWHHRLAHGNPIAGAIRKMIWKRSERKRGVSVPGSDGPSDSAKP
jgi:hypothetical protein